MSCLALASRWFPLTGLSLTSLRVIKCRRQVALSMFCFEKIVICGKGKGKVSRVKIQFEFWFILLSKWIFYTFWLMGRCFDYDSHLYSTEQTIVFILWISWQFILWICNGALLSYDALRRRNLIKNITPRRRNLVKTSWSIFVCESYFVWWYSSSMGECRLRTPPKPGVAFPPAERAWWFL